MRISDYLQKNNCVLDLKSAKKEDAIMELAGCLSQESGVIDKDTFIADVLERERLGSTGIGNKVAIPHSPTDGVRDLVIGFGRSQRGIDFGSIDGDKVNMIFMLGTNPKELNVYLKVLARLSKLLGEESFRKELAASDSADQVIELFRRYEG